MARLVVWLAVGLGLAGCTLWGDAGVTAGQVRADLAAHLGEVRAAQAAALALWDRVIFGETVSCAETISVPAELVLSPQQRTAHPDAETISAALSEATRAVRDSADLWAIECADPRPLVSLDMARAGRMAALAATDPLDRAATLLSAWPAG
ncbi:MAG: hypothetical protein OZ934_09140 [Anaerolineae bacterium]|nr:hypothetical protein [Anaerolineae bacterium]